MPVLINEPFLTPQEVASFLRVSRSTVYRWIDLGILKAVKPKGAHNGVLRISREAVVEFSERTWDD